jgi:hypothetical protein
MPQYETTVNRATFDLLIDDIAAIFTTAYRRSAAVHYQHLKHTGGGGRTAGICSHKMEVKKRRELYQKIMRFFKKDRR